MDKNSIIGIVLIGLVLFGYMMLTKPSEAELAEQRRVRDSIAMSERQLEAERIAQQQKYADLQSGIDTLTNADSLPNEQLRDSLQMITKYGVFAAATKGDEHRLVVENGRMTITFTNQGGKIHSVELNDYKTYSQEPLLMYDNDSASEFGIELLFANKLLRTNELYFRFDTLADTLRVADKPLPVSMILQASDNRCVEFRYTIHPNSYMLDFDINFSGMSSDLEYRCPKLCWVADIPALERGRDWESNNTTIFYRMKGESADNLNEVKEVDDFKSSGIVDWIAFKQQFFSSILISKNQIESPIIKLQKFDESNTKYLKRFSAAMSLNPQDSNNVKMSAFSMYFGPNKFKDLKKYDMDLEDIVPLGWGIFGWVNEYAIIPLFNLLSRFISNYGIIILILTVIIKIVLFPLTRKSYMSTAKMRFLKPELDELAKKYPKGKEMERQQATMTLYKKAGISPMGGCLPLLLQFPILIAMFRFFPASIELRQQPFLWANDLSSYDAICEWSTNIPIISWLYGNHISLFALLMAISMLVSTKISMSSQPSNNGMPGMKFMMYFMPVMMLFWFNKYSSGLSYYYFLANIFTIGQNFVIQKFFVNEEKMRAKMRANAIAQKAKPKSKWQKRMEEAMRMQQQQQKQKKK